MRKKCPHDGFHGLRSRYDRQRGLLRFYWICEDCGARLREAHRSDYRPSFNPHGNDSHLAAAG